MTEQNTEISVFRFAFDHIAEKTSATIAEAVTASIKTCHIFLPVLRKSITYTNTAINHTNVIASEVITIWLRFDDTGAFFKPPSCSSKRAERGIP